MLRAVVVEVKLETTRVEIVDVEVTITPRGTPTTVQQRKLHDCIEDAMWDVALVLPLPQAHATHEVRFDP
jgi:hypothetical protein